MEYHLKQIEQGLLQLHNGSHMETHQLYHGIWLSFLTLKTDQITLSHEALDHILEINYCSAGRMGWEMDHGNTVYLGPGDYNLHTMDLCAHSVMTLPGGYYEGLLLCIDLDVITHNPPKLLAGTGLTGEFFTRKFCRSGHYASFAATALTESIFSGFYGQPEAWRLPYWKVKALELLLYLGKCEVSARDHLADYQADQIEIIRNVHKHLTDHMEEHVTIEALAKQYLINPTTLKTVFKAVYGNSIASHIREHRMEQAATLLLETRDSIAEIARAVGYESQSKFTAAFKEYYQVLPTKYRKQH